MKRFSQTVLLLLVTSFFMIGCNTVEGVGKDVQKVGEEVEEAAD